MDTSKKFSNSGFVSADPHFPDTAQMKYQEPTIGEIISKANNLTAEQIESIVNYQRSNNVRFGEAAVALGLANADDVMWALAQQFHYPYSGEHEDTYSKELVIAKSPFSVQAEAFRTTRSHLIMKMYSGTGPRKALAVLSTESGDGKSYFAANMAAAFSQLSGRTLLIDANMRNPRLHEIFKLSNASSGLTNILTGRAVSNVIQSVKSLPSLFVLPVGTVPPNPLELAERPAFGLLIRELLTKFDHVLVDTPAMSQGMDGAVIAAKCGAAVLMARQNHTRINNLQSLVGALRMSDTTVVGSIVVDY
ncbi:MAG: polysaccharide biosynthesis tyrosine autokinase [Aquabacterium sp.]|uniref:polysaccharide biosynthesis tyrosine autokinase n=1 Tax=Aquabacterium sp. TaxID=1872578 RepID=UPI0025C5DC3D|nr:polysaccharide biosynthesis tyrosine autokinase [Aquabacterium sp.]MBI5926419.1 polysaccharide biosynthesis tyrosine autokinase [Aquabacterium sp.]